MVGVETNSSQAYAPACPLKNKVILMKKAVFAILLSTAAIVAGPVACSKGDEAEKTEATYTAGTELGISKAAMDTSVKPGDDFYAYANGNWQKTTEIPADRSSTGAFYTAFLEPEKRVRELVEIGRASCRERRRQRVYISVAAGPLKKKKK